MLTAAEKKELAKLMVTNLDKDAKPLSDADTKALKRIDELLSKQPPSPEIGPAQPMTIKGYVRSELCATMVNEGAEFAGIEVRNHGSEERPKTVIREWLYVGKNGDRKAGFCQYEMGHRGDARFIEAGRTIAASAYRRFQKA